MLIGFGIGFGCIGLWHQGSYAPAVNMAAMNPTTVQRPSKMVAPAALPSRHSFLPGSAPIAHPCRGVACHAGSQVSGNAVKEEQLRKMTSDDGFISALDESGGTSPKTLAAYGITDKDYKDDAEMMSMVHDLRA